MLHVLSMVAIRDELEGKRFSMKFPLALIFPGLSDTMTDVWRVDQRLLHSTSPCRCYCALRWTALEGMTALGGNIDQ